ncbi:MAG: hypothetical protein AB7O29_11465, partial [Acidimicrobiia bacterium]
DLVAVLAGAAVALAVNPQNIPESEFLSGWYQTLSSVSGVLLGLAGVAVTVVFAVTPTARLENVYQSVGPRLVRLVMSSLAGIAVATAGFVALFLVPTSNSEVRNCSTAALVILLALRFGRLWWLFGRVLTALMLRPAEGAESAPAPPPWTRPDLKEDEYVLPTRRARRRA